MKKEDLPQLFQDRIERFNRLFLEGTKDTDNPHNFEESNLYEYELMCMKDALNFIKLFENDKRYQELLNEFYKTEKNNTLYDFIEFLKKEYNLEVSEDHSGNSIGATFQLAQCYISSPKIFIYMHGALAGLVGDKGYYDDRSDIPEIEKAGIA